MTKLNLVAEIASINYCVEISKELFLKLLDNPNNNIYHALTAINDVDSIEWDGHFGPNIFFRAFSDEAKEAFLKELTKRLDELSKE